MGANPHEIAAGVQTAIAETQWLGRRLELIAANLRASREHNLATDILAAQTEASAIQRRLTELGLAAVKPEDQQP